MRRINAPPDRANYGPNEIASEARRMEARIPAVHRGLITTGYVAPRLSAEPVAINLEGVATLGSES